jgi:hypothetical protein
MRLMGDQRRLCWLLIVAAVAIATDAAVAADLAIPFRKKPADFSMQKGPPHCARWTDECVNCARGATSDEAPVCSNIGFACQPKAIRCLTPETSQGK